MCCARIREPAGRRRATGWRQWLTTTIDRFDRSKPCSKSQDLLISWFPVTQCTQLLVSRSPDLSPVRPPSPRHSRQRPSKRCTQVEQIHDVPGVAVRGARLLRADAVVHLFRRAASPRPGGCRRRGNPQWHSGSSTRSSARALLLQDQPGWTPEDIQAVVDAGRQDADRAARDAAAGRDRVLDRQRRRDGPASLSHATCTTGPGGAEGAPGRVTNPERAEDSESTGIFTTQTRGRRDARRPRWNSQRAAPQARPRMLSRFSVYLRYSVPPW